MERRDLIKDEIEQLGRVLGKLIADFFGLKTQGKVSQGIEITNEALQTELDLDIEKILSLKAAELTDYIRLRKLTNDHIEQLADYLTEIGKYTIESDKKEARTIFEKILELYEIVDTHSKAISLERMNKEIAVKNLLSQC